MPSPITTAATYARLPRSSRIRLHRWAVAGDQTRPGLDAGAQRHERNGRADADREVRREITVPRGWAAAVAAVPRRRCWTADRTRCPTRIRLRYSPRLKPLSRG